MNAVVVEQGEKTKDGNQTNNLIKLKGEESKMYQNGYNLGISIVRLRCLNVCRVGQQRLGDETALQTR